MNGPGNLSMQKMMEAAALNAVPNEEQVRAAKQSQLWFKALLAAERTKCDCATCQLMREQADIIAGEERTSVTASG